MQCLMKKFVLEKLKRGENVPDIALTYVTSKKEHLFLDAHEDDIDKKYVWPDPFVDEFIEYIRNFEVDPNIEDDKNEWEERLKKAVDKCHAIHESFLDLRGKKESLVKDVVDKINETINKKETSENVLLDCSRLLYLNLSIIEGELNTLLIVIQAKKETRYSSESFKKLQESLEREQQTLKAKIRETETLLNKYQDLMNGDHSNFKNLLKKFKELKKEKELLAKENALMNTF